ncbi:MAG: 30S ribosomal protein S17 [Patescibacteria group bacterium]
MKNKISNGVENKNKGKILKGKIVSDIMDKTVVVLVESFRKYPKYEKYMKISKRFKAHDEKNEYKKDDLVMIQECRPISKDKRFRILRKVL